MSNLKEKLKGWAGSILVIVLTIIFIIGGAAVVSATISFVEKCIHKEPVINAGTIKACEKACFPNSLDSIGGGQCYCDLSIVIRDIKDPHLIEQR